MEQKPTRSMAEELMLQFADATGLTADGKPTRRYLWTDAFAVCNFLELFRRTREERYRKLALLLTAQVHHRLGRHREDDRRTGWLSGLGEEEGKGHPTIGGLRIGKTLNERRPGEPVDERLEWDRDGQYYHYLSKWMHALNRVSRVTGDPTFNLWAIELAKTVHARFSYGPPSGRKRLYWKMSIDLSRPLVPSMGQHDPLDGLVTYRQLQATATEAAPSAAPDLSDEIADLTEICRGQNWVTDDPLGTGGLLFDACRMAQLMVEGYFDEGGLLGEVLDAAQRGLEAFGVRSPFGLPAEYRLAFRELGLSIGLKGLEKMQGVMEENPGIFARSLHKRADDLMRYLPSGETIETFWSEGKNRESKNWMEHGEINTVMLATSLAPEAFLTIVG